MSVDDVLVEPWDTYEGCFDSQQEDYWFAQVSRAWIAKLLREVKGHRATIKVATFIAAHIGVRGDPASLSAEYVRQYCGRGQETLRNAIDELVACKLIHVDRVISEWDNSVSYSFSLRKPKEGPKGWCKVFKRDVKGDWFHEATPAQIRVYLAHCFHGRTHNGLGPPLRCGELVGHGHWASHRTIAKVANVSKRTAIEATGGLVGRVLESNEWGRHGRQRKYRWLDPSRAQHAVVTQDLPTKKPVQVVESHVEHREPPRPIQDDISFAAVQKHYDALRAERSRPPHPTTPRPRPSRPMTPARPRYDDLPDEIKARPIGQFLRLVEGLTRVEERSPR